MSESFLLTMDDTVIKSQLSTLKKRVKAGRPAAIPVEVRESEKEYSSPTFEHDDPTAEDGPSQPATDLQERFSALDMKREPEIESTSPAAIIKWQCGECLNECIPVMRESRCLCGHRMKEHKAGSGSSPKFACSSRGCRCKNFFYMVAEGAWILRCRCKHKHIEHDCGPGPHKCEKCSSCTGFDSPWVCNCGHTWSSHRQYTVSVTERNAAVVLGAKNKQQHFYRQDGIPDDLK